jgi:hypothetical protein
MRRLMPLALLLVPLGACTPQPQEPQVSLPPTARTDSVADPTRGAILTTSYVFGQPGTVAGDPASAAEALANLEYLTAELATGPRWRDLDPLVAPMLARGRAEARAAFGLDPAAPPQRALDGLYGTAAALRQGDRARAAAALAPLTGTDRADGTLQRLAALPYLPEAAAATARARAAMNRRDQDSGRNWRN